MSEILNVTGLQTRIDSGGGVVHPLDGVDLTLNQGETFAIVGESGCGKSMTALSIMRLLPEAAWIEAGQVNLDGSNVLTLPEYGMRDVRGARMGMIFQEPATSLNPVLTCGEQIVEVLERHRIEEGAASRASAVEWLKRVGIPDPERRMDEYPFQLSGGMKQRVMIALALAAGPQVLIADEPTTALDVTIQAQILDLLVQLQQQRGMAMLLITHDLGVVAKMAHRVALMYAGEIIEVGARQEFFGKPLHPYAQKLFASLPGATKRGEPLASIKGLVPPLLGQFTGCRFADRCEYAFERCRVEAPAWLGPPDNPASSHRARCHLLDPAEAHRARPAHQAAPAAADAPASLAAEPGEAGNFLVVQDLKVHFPIRKGLFKKIVGYVKAVDGVSLAIRTGRTLALVGESGCGKTTVGKGLLQLVPVTGGEVRFAGENVIGLTGAALKRMRSRMQLVFQDPFGSLNPRMRVGDIIAEGMASFGIGKDSAGRAARVVDLLAQVGLGAESRYKYPHEFSGGQRQRIAVARALAVDPRLIVCDEPTSALDVSVQAQILNLLKELQQRLGVSYLFITHNIGVVEYLAHEVAVMYLGRIVESGTAEEVLRLPKHPYTQALLAAVPRVDAAAEGAQDDLSHEVKERLMADVPSPANPPAGCHFHTRCPYVTQACKAAYPEEVAVTTTHRVRCILVK